MPATRLNTFNGDGSIRANQIADASITTSKILDEAVNANKIATLSPNPAGNYGSVSAIPVISVNSKGQITSASTAAISTTPADGSITYAKLSTSATESDNVATRTAKVWANFSGTTGAISQDFNVSSVTDNGTGNFTVNFSSNLSTADYGFSVSISRISTTYPGEGACCCMQARSVGAAQVTFYTSFIPGKDNAYLQDVTTASVICFA